MEMILRKWMVFLAMACLLLGLVGGPGSALASSGGSVTPSMVASSPVTTCDGATTVTMTVDGVSPAPSLTAVDVMLVLDRSGSMMGQPLADLKVAANSFVSTMDESDGSLDGNITASQVGLVSFESSVTLESALTHDANAIHAKINALYAGNMTSMGDGIKMGQAQLAGGTAKDVLILMTDGFGNWGTLPQSQAAAEAKAAGIELYTIGLGTGINAGELKTMATDLAHYYQAPTSADLTAIFNEIAHNVAGPAATNLSFVAHPAADFEIAAGAAATKGTLTADGASLNWSLNELRTETVQITYTLQHVTNIGGILPIYQDALLQYTDSDGNLQTVDYAGMTVEVQGCNQAPMANAGLDQTVTMGTSGLAPVTLDGTASTDDGQVQPLAYEWFEGAVLLGSGATFPTELPLGDHIVTLKVYDGQYAASDEVFISAVVTYDSLEAVKHDFLKQGLIKNQGIVTSLDQKLRAARAAHERGQFETEDNILQAFVQEVNAQAGKGIIEPAVTVLNQGANWLMSHN